ncbi:putative sphingolipid delta(4)-desaturase/C4-monooxygenase [Porphyridium purpureum]|uniref:Putative sphingolipid delta(4)-desaturase/C4-monooxygenase n=1 Tax=Porphyridium purpureum TaxID=35688 RepID=A0A5J4Z2F4_PORPP|nr:putative sphingolipid delta(4)-desaturase/C4-monooxygenase [Porphyridium purpureum]|eukprot:POR8728..scf208_2
MVAHVEERAEMAKDSVVLSTEKEESAAAEESRRKHPHAVRRAEIMGKHPEIAQYVGTYVWSALYIVALVLAQYALAIGAATRLPWYAWMAVAYGVGAVIDHAMWVLIHDATHNLIFQSVTLNRIAVCVANSIHVLPSGMLFRYYHILHHIELNKIDKDPDVPASWEAKFVGNSPFRKALWLGLFFVFQSVRMVFYSYRVPAGMEMFWIALNWLTCIMPALVIYEKFGAAPVLFLVFASISSVGLHPLGARWIQEHYPTQPFQSTYSYYGVGNKVAFNIGFHNEHHDFPSVPYVWLPEVKKAAPEYYNTLFAYSSYTRLLFDFILNREWSLIHRWETEQLLEAAELKQQQLGEGEKQKLKSN